MAVTPAAGRSGHAQKLYFEDVNEGDTAPVRKHTLSRTDLVRYAGASGDYNPMHHDEIKATGAGLPSVFGHGMFSMGVLGTALTDYVGIGNLASFRVRFSKQTWPGEEFQTRITVSAKRKEEGENLVDLDCELLNQDGEVKASGTATARLPSNGGRHGAAGGGRAGVSGTAVARLASRG